MKREDFFAFNIGPFQMCVIIDASRAGECFGGVSSPDARVVIDWIDLRGGKVVLGGKLTTELFRIEAARRWMTERMRSGKAKAVGNRDVNLEEMKLIESGLCQSDDAHIIALARLSGARTLFSRDKKLQTDFKSKRLVSNQRGSIYSVASHVHLLRHTYSCGEL